MQTRSDFNTPKKQQREYWSDFNTNLDVHPVTMELSRLTNDQAVKRSLKNIILTNKTERLFNPGFGGNIHRLLFEPMNEHTSESIKHAINDVILEYEPRVKLESIEVIPNEQHNLYRINIFFMIVNQESMSAMTVLLYRVR